MIKSNKFFIFAIIFPILSLMALSLSKYYKQNTGMEITLPITGYDPRDLLSGHYLIYRIDYGIKKICSPRSKKRVAYLCLESKKFSYEAPNNCKQMLKGECRYTRFKAGIERFYIPQNNAKELEDLIRDKKAEIVISLQANGSALIKDLLIDGESWNKKLEK